MTDARGDVAASGSLDKLVERLLWAADVALDAGEIAQARATVEDVRTIDPANGRAAELIARVDQMQRRPAGERVLMTLLFSDVVESTQLAERIGPEVLRDVYGIYRTAATSAVEYYGGRILQYLGDGILATFGYPLAHEDDARRGILAALDLIARLDAARDELVELGGVEIEVRAGLHTGRVVVADLGVGATREQGSIIGVAPNLAARLQSEAEPGQVVVSDVTRQLVETDFDMVSLGQRNLKGISRAVDVYAVERQRSATARLDAERYRHGASVGRADIRRVLADAWEEVRRLEDNGSQAGRAFLIAGEAGSGKSRLAVDVRTLVSVGGGDTLAAECSPYHGAIALWPLGQMMARYLGLDELPEAERLAALVDHVDEAGMTPARAVPLLAPLVGVPVGDAYPTPEVDPSALREMTIATLNDWLGTLGDRAPRMLLVEDLEWADPSTIDLLGRRSADPPAHLLSVMTTRDDEGIPWRQSVSELELGRLDDDEARDLIDEFDEDGMLGDDVRDAILARSEGIPLFIEELTRSALAAGPSEALPLRLEELLAGRLRTEGLDVRLAQVAAVIGASFDVETLSGVDPSPDTIVDRLAALERAGIIERTVDATDEYRFRHSMMRDAAYEIQVTETRLETHAAVAEVLVARNAGSALVARHLDLAGDEAGAVPHYIAGAQEAQERGNHAEATQMLSRGLELVAGFPTGADRDLAELTIRMLRSLSGSSVNGFAAPEVRADFEAAGELTDRIEDRPEVMPSLIAIWAYWLTAGDMYTAGPIVTRLLEMVAEPALAWFEPEVAACAGYQSFYEGDLAAAAAHFESAIAGIRARPPGSAVSEFWPLPNDPLAVSAIALACISTLRGDADSTERWERTAIEHAESLPFPRGPFSLAFVKIYVAWIRRFLGRVDEGRVIGSDVIAIGQEHGFAYWMALGSLYIAADPDTVAAALGTLRAIGHEAFRASSELHLASLHAEAGDLDRAEELIETALASARRSGEHVLVPELLRYRAELRQERDPADPEIRVDLDDALVMATEQGADLVALRIAVDLASMPEGQRPAEWSHQLKTALSRLPEDAPYPIVAAARDLLPA